jgi:hypothetical protein
MPLRLWRLDYFHGFDVEETGRLIELHALRMNPEPKARSGGLLQA